MMLKDSDIEQLIDSFLEGTATPRQERQLYAYFASEQVSPQWEPYKQMFCDYGAMGHAGSLVVTQRSRLRRVWGRVAAGAAAAVVLLVGTFALLRLHEERTLQSLYAGSYVIENGRRTDDLRTIAPNIRSTLAYAATVEKQVRTNDQVLQQAEQDVVANIGDAKMQKAVMQILSE